jgi:hypothetical protein
MIVLSEAAPHETPSSASARDNIEMTEAARMAGCRIYHIPKDFRECGTAEAALWHIPGQDKPTLAAWSGFIPSRERYDAVYEELLRKNIYLLNTPAEHLTALEFDRSYPLLAGITPESVVLTEREDWAQAEALGYPLFLRGAARSRKAEGWKACVASSREELKHLVDGLFDLPYRSRGKVIVRKLVPLRHSRLSDEGFPLGREYRVFLYRDRVLGYGYYWEGDDPLRDLSTAHEAEMLSLALEAARRVGVPFMAVDIGQLEDESWVVIEVGDAQFAGASQTPLIPLWIATRAIEDYWRPPPSAPPSNPK